MDSSNRIKIYALINTFDSDRLLLTSTKGGLDFISGKVKAVDPSSIYAATRIFVKKLFNSQDASNWNSPLFLTWLRKFTDCELVRHENGNVSFVLNINAADLPSNPSHKIQLLPFADVKTTYTPLYEEYKAVLTEIEDQYAYYKNTERTTNNYIMLCCEPDPNWVLIYEALYQGHWKDKAEKWKSYFMANLEWPSQEELAKVQGIVISGSEWSVYDPSIEAIPIFLERLKKLVEDFPNIKIVGVCFGCQALAQGFGGRVGKMKLTQPMLMNRERINFMNDFYEKHMKKINHPSIPSSLDCFYITECHGDNVEVLPNGAVLYGTSDRTPVEVFGIGDNILAFQGHPEFNESLLIDYILPEHKDNWPNFDRIFEESTASFKDGGLDFKIMDALIENFLKGRAC